MFAMPVRKGDYWLVANGDDVIVSRGGIIVDLIGEKKLKGYDCLYGDERGK